MCTFPPTLFPGKTPALLNPPAQSGGGFSNKWLADAGAVDVLQGYTPDTGRSWIDIVLAGTATDPVVVTNIRVEVTSRQPQVATGVVVYQPCGGPMQSRYVLYDLDTAVPKPIASNSDPTKDFSVMSLPRSTTPLTLPYSVTRVDKLDLLLGVESHKYTKWVAWIDWTNGSRSGSLKIDLDGRPFAVAPSPSGSQLVFGSGHPWYDGKTGKPLP